jgi:hypothetical protein
MGRFLLGLIAALVALVVVGFLAIKIFAALLGFVGYLLVGLLVIGGGAYVYYRAKRAVGPGTRTRNRLDAAASTYRQRNR